MVNHVNFKFLHFRISFLTILLKSIFIAGRNSADDFINGIQSCFNSHGFTLKVGDPEKENEDEIK